jgi:PAS domain S-box-containing protein
MRLSPRTSGFWVGTLAVTLATALVAFAVVTALTLRERALSGEIEDLHKVSLVLAEHANRIVFGADLLASSFEERFLQAGASTAEDFRHLADTQAMHQALLDAVLLTADVDALSLIDADGRLINSSRTFPVLALNLADRDYFRALRDTPGLPYVISAPLKNRLTGQESIFLARRVESADRRFLGVVTASISTSRFTKLFAAVLHGPGDAVALYRRDGTLLVNEPSAREGRKADAEVSTFLEQTLERGEKGAIRTASSSEAGSPELLSLHAVRGYPLAVVASNTEASALTDWNRLALLLGLLGASTLGLTLVLGAALLRQWRMQMQLKEAGKLQRLNQELEATIAERRQAQEDLLRAYGENRAVTEAVHDILFMLDPGGRLVWWNRQTEVAIGRPADRLRGALAFEFFEESDRPTVVQAVARAATEGQATMEVRLLTVDGPLDYQFNGVRVLDAQGQLIGMAGSGRDISERKRHDEVVRVSEQRLQQAVRVAGIGIFDHDHVTDKIYWSAEQREIYGVGPDVAIDLALYLQHVFAEDLDSIGAAVQHAHDPDGEGLFDVEHRIKRSDGKVRVLKTRSRTLFAGEGSARHKVRTIGAVLDVTDRIRAEEVLRASEESLAVTLQSIGDAVIATDLDGGVTRMNTVAERLTAWSIASAKGRPLADVFRIVDASSREPLSSPVQQVLSKGEIVGLANHAMLLARDGREYHISDSAAPIRDASGRVTGVVLVFSDVSEQYRARQSLLAHTEALRVRDWALTQISQGVMITNHKRAITYVNPGFEALTGYPAAEAIGRDPKFLQGAATSSATLAEISSALGDGRGFRGEILNYRKDGSSLWIALDISPIRDEAGVLTGFVGTQRDITERKQAEAERSSLETQLRESQKMESIGTLAGGIAHDFNNILGAILGNVALARGDLPAEHEANKSLQQIHKASVRARDLVQQILTFSRRQPQQMENQPLRPVVEDAMSLLRSTLPAGVGVDTVLADTPLYVNADSTQIQQVLMNLCTNAWHALKDSTGRITVGLEAVSLEAAGARAVGALPPGHYAHLWVSDTGVGMNAQTRERIFEPFFTTKPPGQGTGLGLAVVHGIVTAHHGAISVESEPGKGSTFHLYFPTQAGTAVASAPAPTSHDGHQGHGEHVLYVDDDEVMLLMVERLLQRSGYRATCCQNASEALAVVRAAPNAIDVVVTDYNMPAASGVDLAKALARIRPDLPVVISSGYVSEELRAEAKQVGARHVYQKEDTFDELPRLLRRLLSQ